MSGNSGSEQEEWTCGKGLAASSELPAKLAELLGATAEVLERHARALDPSEAAGREELRAYESLVRGNREAAERLRRLAEEMAGYRTLPMASHDLAVMQDPGGQAEAFGRLVGIQRELAALLGERVKQAEQMMR